MFSHKGIEYSREELEVIVQYFRNKFGIGYLWDYSQKAIRQNPEAADEIIDDIRNRVDFKLFYRIGGKGPGGRPSTRYETDNPSEAWLDHARRSGLSSWVRAFNVNLTLLKTRAADPNARFHRVEEVALRLLMKYPDLGRWPEAFSAV